MSADRPQYGTDVAFRAAEVARAVRRAAAPVTGDRRLVAAVLDAGGILADYETLMRSWRHVYGGQDIDVIFADVTAVHRQGGRLWVKDRRIDVALRFFTDDEPVVDPETGALERWSATWGLCFTDAGYAGACMRALPSDSAAVIGAGSGAPVRFTGLLTALAPA
ncbi:hypothetical protein [Dactylosporangium sp. NPDC051541]|uniref:hypothetical protein n=1 Tax=Dactylosporangium sp. NPDC051541 TaxID=3363977 RepID=UPI0037B28E26